MKSFFKPSLLLSLFAAFVCASFAYAGPRPAVGTQSNSSSSSGASKKELRSGVSLLSYPGNFTKPSPGGAAGLTNYASVMPAARLDLSFSSVSPYPTNKWFTSIFTDSYVENDAGNNIPANFSDNYGNRISPTPMTIIYYIGYPWSPANLSQSVGWGYSIGGQIIKSNVKDFNKDGNNAALTNGAGDAVRVNNIAAFSVQGAYGTGLDDIIKAASTKLKSYNDWSFTAVLEDSANSAYKMTSTFGKGFLFAYNYFSPGVTPRLEMKYPREPSAASFYYSNNGIMTQVTVSTASASSVSVFTDRVFIKIYTDAADNNGDRLQTYQYFGIYAPEGSTFTFSSKYNYNNGDVFYRQFCDIVFPASATSESGRYLSIALLKSPSETAADVAAWDIFNDYYQYAYNFVTNTQTSWSYNQANQTLTTDFNFTFDVKRTGGSFISNQTVFALYPHQWKNLQTPPSPNKIYTYKSIRGALKANAGASFSTKHNFNGVMPFLTYQVPDGANRNTLLGYIQYDKTFDPALARIEGVGVGNSNTYYHGKALARAANLIPVFHQFGDYSSRNSMINKLKTELSAWYSGQNANKNFGYDSSWGGIVGSFPNGGSAPNFSDFGASKYNDHHFHYGYFVYASAILAIFDPDFASSSQYKGIVDLLVKEFANPVRNDSSFSFLRNFDVYEGHSYANGRGGGSLAFGQDEESASEAMNAWAGIILWGMATNNQDFIDLGVYGYTTQYEAIKNYYFNMDGDIWTQSQYPHKSVGMLFDNEYNWSLWWNPKMSQSIMGIQVMPLTPSMLYLGYNTAYASAFYNDMLASPGYDSSKSTFWKDVWLRFKALFDPSGALSDWNAANLPAGFPDSWNYGDYAGDDGSSMSYSYYFIHFFNSLGTVDTSYYANVPSYLVTSKNGTKTYIAYNSGSSTKTVTFSARAGGAFVGQMVLPPGVTGKTSNFSSFEYSVLEDTYTPTTNTSNMRNVFGVYSESYDGVTWDGPGPYSGGVSDQWFNGHAQPVTGQAGTPEGSEYFHLYPNAAAGGAFYYYFNANQDFSEYAGGQIECWVRSSDSGAGNNINIGYKYANTENVFPINSLYGGTFPPDGQWHKVVLPLTGAIPDTLSVISCPMMIRTSVGVTFDIDGFVWKKSSQMQSMPTMQLTGRSGISESITFATSSFNQGVRWIVGEQYIEIDSNYAPLEENWCVQIYTDNKNIVGVSSPAYNGNIASTTISGLVGQAPFNNRILPLLWKASISTTTAEITQQNSDKPGLWGALRDASSFSDAPGALKKGSEELRFWDSRGYKWDADNILYGSMSKSKIRLYFAVDSSKAIKISYGTKIVIEYFNE